MAPLYKPPTKVTTLQIPYQALVVRADPEFERKKHREIEYEFTNRVFRADPYHRGAYDTPQKTVMVNYSGTTFNVGDLTGVGFDFVTVVSQNPTPRQLTTRTAAQMFADITGAFPTMDWALRVSNFGGTSDLTLVPGAGVVFVGIIPIKAGTFSDIVCTFLDTADAVFQIASAGNPINSV